ncbi:hypothetical protein OG429_06640 [Streptomyces sp. NBC_00190]|uniref:hypothetical protein n=1 Tax=unclassified Streptomyces TaxID=2593676 RepID=UPI002E27EB3B|nr:hypothetical protein [Streptomyces sp. NBC_00190]
MSRTSQTKRLVLFATSTALAAGGALLPSSAFATPAEGHTNAVTLTADRHGDSDSDYHKNKGYKGYKGRGKGKGKGKPKPIQNMPGCHFYKSEVYCKPGEQKPGEKPGEQKPGEKPAEQKPGEQKPGEQTPKKPPKILTKTPKKPPKILTKTPPKAISQDTGGVVDGTDNATSQDTGGVVDSADNTTNPDTGTSTDSGGVGSDAGS